MHIRKAEMRDLDDLRRIYAAARQWMSENGNPTQWGDTWPPEEVYVEDIGLGRSYVIEEDGRVHAVFALILGDDPTYSYIEGGAWLDDEPYGTIHRIASDGELHGVFQAAVDHSLGIIGNLRVDTHADNAVMHHAIRKAGFARCGIIYIDDGTPRTAYQLNANRA